jgi:hypothetical protein
MPTEVTEVVEKPGPKVIEVKTEHVVAELKLEEEEEEEVMEVAEKPAKEEKFTAEEPVESVVETKEEVVEKEVTEEQAVEPEPAPKGPPIPSTLPYRESLCPAGRPHLTPVR